jgi:hypothetical protein
MPSPQLTQATQTASQEQQQQRQAMTEPSTIATEPIATTTMAEATDRPYITDEESSDEESSSNSQQGSSPTGAGDVGSSKKEGDEKDKESYVPLTSRSLASCLVTTGAPLQQDVYALLNRLGTESSGTNPWVFRTQRRRRTRASGRKRQSSMGAEQQAGGAGGEVAGGETLVRSEESLMEEQRKKRSRSLDSSGMDGAIDAPSADQMPPRSGSHQFDVSPYPPQQQQQQQQHPMMPQQMQQLIRHHQPPQQMMQYPQTYAGPGEQYVDYNARAPQPMYQREMPPQVQMEPPMQTYSSMPMQQVVQERVQVFQSPMQQPATPVFEKEVLSSEEELRSVDASPITVMPPITVTPPPSTTTHSMMPPAPRAPLRASLNQAPVGAPLQPQEYVPQQQVDVQQSSDPIISSFLEEERANSMQQQAQQQVYEQGSYESSAGHSLAVAPVPELGDQQQFQRLEPEQQTHQQHIENEYAQMAIAPGNGSFASHSRVTVVPVGYPEQQQQEYAPPMGPSAGISRPPPSSRAAYLRRASFDYSMQAPSYAPPPAAPHPQLHHMSVLNQQYIENARLRRASFDYADSQRRGPALMPDGMPMSRAAGLRAPYPRQAWNGETYQQTGVDSVPGFDGVHNLTTNNGSMATYGNYEGMPYHAASPLAYSSSPLSSPGVVNAYRRKSFDYSALAHGADGGSLLYGSSNGMMSWPSTMNDTSSSEMPLSVRDEYASMSASASSSASMPQQSYGVPQPMRPQPQMKMMLERRRQSLCAFPMRGRDSFDYAEAAAGSHLDGSNGGYMPQSAQHPHGY